MRFIKQQYISFLNTYDRSMYREEFENLPSAKQGHALQMQNDASLKRLQESYEGLIHNSGAVESSIVVNQWREMWNLVNSEILHRTYPIIPRELRTLIIAKQTSSGQKIKILFPDALKSLVKGILQPYISLDPLLLLRTTPNDDFLFLDISRIKGQETRIKLALRQQLIGDKQQIVTNMQADIQKKMALCSLDKRSSEHFKLEVEALMKEGLQLLQRISMTDLDLSDLIRECVSYGEKVSQALKPYEEKASLQKKAIPEEQKHSRTPRKVDLALLNKQYSAIEDPQDRDDFRWVLQGLSSPEKIYFIRRQKSDSLTRLKLSYLGLVTKYSETQPTHLVEWQTMIQLIDSETESRAVFGVIPREIRSHFSIINYCLDSHLRIVFPNVLKKTVEEVFNNYKSNDPSLEKRTDYNADYNTFYLDKKSIKGCEGAIAEFFQQKMVSVIIHFQEKIQSLIDKCCSDDFCEDVQLQRSAENGKQMMFRLQTMPLAGISIMLDQIEQYEEEVTDAINTCQSNSIGLRMR